MLLNHCRAASLETGLREKYFYFPRTKQNHTSHIPIFQTKIASGAINLLTNSITSAGAPRVLQQRTDFLDLNLTCHFKPGLPEKCRNFCQQHKNNLVPHSSKSCSKEASPRRRGIVGLARRGGSKSLYQSTVLGSRGSKLGGGKEKLSEINQG